MSDDRANKLGSAYFLAFAFFAFAMLLWLRGMGRILLPALLIGLLGYAIYRIFRTEPG